MISTIPIINLNGTAAEELIRQNQEAAEAVNAAYDKLQQAAPHGRDFIGKDCAENYKLADTLHRERLHKLYQVLQDLRVIQFDLQTQNAERERRKR